MHVDRPGDIVALAQQPTCAMVLEYLMGMMSGLTHYDICNQEAMHHDSPYAIGLGSVTIHPFRWHYAEGTGIACTKQAAVKIAQYDIAKECAGRAFVVKFPSAVIQERTKGGAWYATAAEMSISWWEYGQLQVSINASLFKDTRFLNQEHFFPRSCNMPATDDEDDWAACELAMRKAVANVVNYVQEAGVLPFGIYFSMSDIKNMDDDWIVSANWPRTGGSGGWNKREVYCRDSEAFAHRPISFGYHVHLTDMVKRSEMSWRRVCGRIPDGILNRCVCRSADME